MTVVKPNVQDEREQYAFHDDITYLRETKAGLTEATVRVHLFRALRRLRGLLER